MILRAALDLAVRRQLVGRNVAAKPQVTALASQEPVDVAGDAVPGMTKAQACGLGFHLVAGAVPQTLVFAFKGRRNRR